MSLVAACIEARVAAGDLAGAAATSWREGAVAEVVCGGWRDIEAGLPMERDTIFRIASMSKPIISVAAMMLVEEGRIALDDPITRWAPELYDMRVCRSPSDLRETVPAARAITFEDLLTHRSGLTYAGFHPGQLSEAYVEALGREIDSDLSPDEWIAALARLPLIDQPGSAFHYGCSTDLLGLILARIDDQPLDEVLKRRIFDPLAMADTGFVVPTAERHRRATAYGFDGAGRLQPLSEGPGGAFVAERPDHLTFFSGGAGLWSTVDNYIAFARLFVGDGTVNGVRLLRPETIALMRANRLSADQRRQAQLLGLPLFAGSGFGLGLETVLEPGKTSSYRSSGGVGTVGWPGAFGGWWQADPTTGSVAVFLTHCMVELDQLAAGLGFGVYQAIADLQVAIAAR